MRCAAILLGTVLAASVADAKPIPILRPERDFAQVHHLRIPIPQGYQWMDIFPCQAEARRWELVPINKARRQSVMFIDRVPRSSEAISAVLESAWSSPRYSGTLVEATKTAHVNDVFAWRAGVSIVHGKRGRTAFFVHIIDGDAYVLRVYAATTDIEAWEGLTAAAHDAAKSVPPSVAKTIDPFRADR